MRSLSTPYIILLLTALMVPALVWAQDTTPAKALQQQFDRYTAAQPQEKVFVHTDKLTYLTGEIMWFKVYALEGKQHIPTPISKIAYVEVLDQYHTPLLQAKISLDEGSGAGSFIIPAGAQSGHYLLRAYTSVMRNGGPDFFFEKTITLISTEKGVSAALTTVADTAGLHVQLFPEGGYLVAGVQSKVAFKVTDLYGKGINASGFILNQQADTVAYFKARKFGIGHFLLIPAPGQLYKAFIKDEYGRVYSTALPPVQARGYAMRLVDMGSKLRVLVSTAGLADDGKQPIVYLFGHTKQVGKLAVASTLTQGQAIFTIDKAVLGEGISHLTLFDDRRQPVCERLYFKRPLQSLDINVTLDAEHYQPRSQVEAQFKSLADGQPLPADMSVAVYKLEAGQQQATASLQSYLWLSSDLKGYIEEPGYYFVNSDTETEAALDDLMLTHGWRKFKWDDVLAEKKPMFAYSAEEKGLLVEGKIVHKQTSQPVAGQQWYMVTPGKRVRLNRAVSDAEGRVRFAPDGLYDLQDLVFMPVNAKDTSSTFTWLNPFYPGHSATRLPVFNAGKELLQALPYQNLHLQVQQAHHQAGLSRFLMPQIDTLPFYGLGDHTYQLDDYNRFRVMEEVLREYVWTVAVRKRRGRFILKVADEGSRLLLKDPLIMLDGIPLSDADKIMAYNPLLVKSIDVVGHKYYLESAYYNGIINFRTYNGDFPGFKLDPAALLVEHEGLQLQREFYVPRYDTPALRASRVPDLRTVLYWSPTVVSGPDGLKTIEFYTSDQQGIYLLQVHGVSRNGLAGSHHIIFQVKKPL